MKGEIQAKIREKYANMTDDERWEDVKRMIATSDDPFIVKRRSLPQMTHRQHDTSQEGK